MSKLSARLRSSIAARLALAYGAIAAVAVAAAALVFYFGTIGVLERLTDAKINAVAARLAASLADGGSARLLAQIRTELNDKDDSDSELFMLISPQGQVQVANLSAWPAAVPLTGKLNYAYVRRERSRVRTRVMGSVLADGSRLLVGRDLSELDALQGVIRRAVLTGLLVSIVLVSAGAVLLRRAIDRRVGEVRLITRRVGAGDLAQRIPDDGEDEFSLLSRDINRMLAQIESLMDGVQHVSNAIAHDLRTPLSRVRNRLYIAVRSCDAASLREVAQQSIEDVDSLIGLFEKLLRIASVESGVRPAFDAQVDLQRVALGMLDLYEAALEEAGLSLVSQASAVPPITGDPDLIASALASLLDNAIKYAGAGAVVAVSTGADERGVSLEVRDSGGGVPEEELAQLARRFYRVDRARHLPGNGIGLSNVKAIVALHGGTLEVRNGHPGLVVRIVFPIVLPIVNEGATA